MESSYPGWEARLKEDLQLRDYRPKTQKSYLQATRQFMRYADKAPEALTEQDVRGYFRYMREEKQAASASINVSVQAVRFFFQRTLGKDWSVLELIRARQPRRLPVVLSRGEVRKLLGRIREPMRKVALTTTYALGLRLSETLRLTPQDIESDRLLVLVRDGKGGRDRAVPLPRPLLGRLRVYWKQERPASRSKELFVSKLTRQPVHPTTLQRIFPAVRKELGWEKKATVHTLRHSYATHLLEAGVSLRTIQHLLGHTALRSTEVYLHVTQPSLDHVQDVVDRLMTGL